MSLILEALRKLERDKPSAERGGFLVVAQSSAERDRSRVALWVASAFILGVGLAVGFGLWFGTSQTARLREARVQATPAPLPSASGAPQSSASWSTPTALAARPAPSAPVAPATGSASSAGATSGAGSPRVTGPDSASAAEEDSTAMAPTAPAASAAPALSRATGPGSAGQPGAHALTAIGQREGRPVAVIDDRLVHEGDEYEGLRVIRIGTDEVEIEVGGKRQTLRFQ